MALCRAGAVAPSSKLDLADSVCLLLEAIVACVVSGDSAGGALVLVFFVVCPVVDGEGITGAAATASASFGCAAVLSGSRKCSWDLRANFG